MEFNYITNPETGKSVSIYGKTGKKVLGNYVKYLQKLGGKKRKSKKRRNKRKSKKKGGKRNRNNRNNNNNNRNNNNNNLFYLDGGGGDDNLPRAPKPGDIWHDNIIFDQRTLEF